MLEKLGNNQSFQELLNTGSVLILISEESKHHHGPPFRVGAYGSQKINVVLAHVHLTMGSVNP